MRTVLMAAACAVMICAGCCSSGLRYHAEYRADASRPAEGVIVAGIQGEIVRR